MFQNIELAYKKLLEVSPDFRSSRMSEQTVDPVAEAVLLEAVEVINQADPSVFRTDTSQRSFQPYRHYLEGAVEESLYNFAFEVGDARSYAAEIGLLLKS